MNEQPLELCQEEYSLSNNAVHFSMAAMCLLFAICFLVGSLCVEALGALTALSDTVDHTLLVPDNFRYVQSLVQGSRSACSS